MLTIYITHTYVTLLALSKSNDQAGGAYWEFFPFEEGNLELLAKAIQSFVRIKKLRADSIVLGLSTDLISSRQILLDQPLSDWEIYQAIQSSFSQYFPGLDSSDFYMDFEVAKWQGMDHEIRQILNLFAAPKAFIKSCVSAFNRVGLEVGAIDVDVLALRDSLDGWKWQGVDAALAKPEIFNMGVWVDGGCVWLMEWLENGNVRLVNSKLSVPFRSSEFLTFFKSSMRDDRLEDPLVFCMGRSDISLQVEKILRDELMIKSCLVKPFSRFGQGAIWMEVVESYSLSLAVHYGLRRRHGH